MELVIIDRATAKREFKRGNNVYIGYQHKEDSAFWARRQFPAETFEGFYNKVKTYLPHTRLKYAIEEATI